MNCRPGMSFTTDCERKRLQLSSADVWWPRYRLLSLSHSIVINGALLVLDSKSVRVASSGVEWPLRSRSWGKVHYPTITPVEYSLVVFLSTLVRACRLACNYRPWASILKSRWYDSGFQCPLLMFLWSKCRQSFHTGTILDDQCDEVVFWSSWT